ncbi:hypothetical protein PHJA_002255500 [Phtheirospermum japonicum]|uniref:Uncharacterized protein n=1 Tax=Phtheirospermum japonicum TaxID=374723 RepID=A0A830D1L3_9LAMI|nr:hypothetical protein PHJA_002255500 [Phtheirospermum japonicum]
MINRTVDLDPQPDSHLYPKERLRLAVKTLKQSEPSSSFNLDPSFRTPPPPCLELSLPFPSSTAAQPLEEIGFVCIVKLPVERVELCNQLSLLLPGANSSFVETF